jgi:hypothetical protein
MRAEFARVPREDQVGEAPPSPPAPGQRDAKPAAAPVVGGATWEDGRGVTIDAEDDEVRGVLARIFRPTSVVVDDPSARPRGAWGEVVLQPGSLEWFRAAAVVRGAQEGLRPRFFPNAALSPGGWDPAAAYRTFRDDNRRREQNPREPSAAEPGAGQEAQRTGALSPGTAAAQPA